MTACMYMYVWTVTEIQEHVNYWCKVVSLWDRLVQCRRVEGHKHVQCRQLLICALCMSLSIVRFRDESLVRD